MRIQHNIMAMNAYRNFNRNTGALSKNLEKLSSGYKINRAGDDAAGLAISEKMRAQITGLKQAQDNAKSGINLVQTAEGAMQEVHDMLNRMVKLADQSANGTYDNDVDRVQLQKEVDQLKSEINRIADSANFNGIKLLDGSLAGTDPTSVMSDLSVSGMVTAQAGTEAVKGKFEVDLSDLTVTNKSSGVGTVTIAVGGYNLSVTLAAGETLSGEEILGKITPPTNGTTLGATSATFNVSVDGGKLVFEMKNAPTNANETLTEFTVTVNSGNNTNIVDNGKYNKGSQVVTHGQQAKQGTPAKATFSLANVGDGTMLKLGDTTYTFAVGKNSQYKNASNVIDLTKYTGEEIDFNKLAAAAFSQVAQNNKQVTVGVPDANGNITITEKEGNIDRDKFKLTDGTDAWKGFIKQGDADAITDKGLTLQIGDTSDSFNQLNVAVQDMHASALGIAGVDISDQAGAAAAVDTIKAAINTVSDVRGTLGATQNRLDHTMNNLSVMTENIQDAESTIRDTDVAAEMMEYTKNNILIQSAQAMLAQANQVPQGVLQLLQ